MSELETLKGTFHDALTGQTVERELTPEEIAKLPIKPINQEK